MRNIIATAACLTSAGCTGACSCQGCGGLVRIWLSGPGPARTGLLPGQSGLRAGRPPQAAGPSREHWGTRSCCTWQALALAQLPRLRWHRAHGDRTRSSGTELSKEDWCWAEGHTLISDIINKLQVSLIRWIVCKYLVRLRDEGNKGENRNCQYQRTIL